MPVTIKVNGLSLVHKGSNGVSIATVPDVCKTPTPGGPVPMPYPNISRTDSLDKGTKTVTADGGNMIAIDGSEFSTSNGDEPGTLGGVKSGTFMKESTWITYSFDVKMEGKGACRLTDKKLQNHGNTADLAGEMQAPVIAPPGGNHPLELDCENWKSPTTGQSLTDCEKKQVCEKSKEINKQAENGVLKRRTGAEMEQARKEGNRAATKQRMEWKKLINSKSVTDSEIAQEFYHDCSFEEWKNGGRAADFRTPFFSPDHIHEIQLNGHPTNPTNLKWMSKNANEWIGRKMAGYNPEKHTGVNPNCCD